jgi:predicted nucleic acid-binding protein
VLTLAIQEDADLVLLDDRKTFNEAQELKLIVASTRAVLKIAEERYLIASYQEVEEALRKQQFYVPNY